MTQSLKLISDLFPGVLLIKPVDAGRLINQSRQSSYNQVCKGRFPIPLVTDHLNRKMVRVIDLANYIDGMTVMPSVPQEVRDKRGRPTKRQQIERAARQSRVMEGI